MSRIEFIRAEERKYHEEFYKDHRLFKEGSWLYKPVKTVVDLLPLLERKTSPRVLDLGCGVGRNSIPIAVRLKSNHGSVVCVDLLKTALEQLHEYAVEFGVEDAIETQCFDISDLDIEPGAYDFIVAVSSLEHVSSESVLEQVLANMVRGTKLGGLNCLVINSSVEEICTDSSNALEPQFEVNLQTEELLRKLQTAYQGWDELEVCVKPLSFQITRNRGPVELRTSAITYVVQRRG